MLVRSPHQQIPVYTTAIIVSDTSSIKRYLSSSIAAYINPTNPTNMAFINRCASAIVDGASIDFDNSRHMIVGDTSFIKKQSQIVTMSRGFYNALRFNNKSNSSIDLLYGAALYNMHVSTQQAKAARFLSISMSIANHADALRALQANQADALQALQANQTIEVWDGFPLKYTFNGHHFNDYNIFGSINEDYLKNKLIMETEIPGILERSMFTPLEL